MNISRLVGLPILEHIPPALHVLHLGMQIFRLLARVGLQWPHRLFYSFDKITAGTALQKKRSCYGLLRRDGRVNVQRTQRNTLHAGIKDKPKRYFTCHPYPHGMAWARAMLITMEQTSKITVTLTHRFKFVGVQSATIARTAYNITLR